MFETYTLSDLLYIAFLFATCYACYVAGKINGSTNLAVMLIEYDILKKTDLEKLEKKLNDEE